MDPRAMEPQRTATITEVPARRRPRKPRGPIRAAPRLAGNATRLKPAVFLVRFLPLLVGTLLVWRFLLLSPLLDCSRAGVETFFHLIPGDSMGHIRVENQGDWIVYPPGPPPERGAVQKAGLLTELGVRMPRGMLQCFSLSLPIFWALVLATYPHQRSGRLWGIGSLVLVGISAVSLLVYLAYWSNNLFVIVSSALGNYLLTLAGKLGFGVVPYAAPLVLVIWLDPELRLAVFGESKPQKPSAPAA